MHQTAAASLTWPVFLVQQKVKVACYDVLIDGNLAPYGILWQSLAKTAEMLYCQVMPKALQWSAETRLESYLF